jgi:hypothetical protein
MQRIVAAVAVLALAGLVACGGDTLTSPTEPVAATLAPAALPTSTPVPVAAPTPDAPRFEAWITDQGWLMHHNLTNHGQHVTACAYLGGRLIEDVAPTEGREMEAAPHATSGLWPMPFHQSNVPPLSQRIAVIGLLGPNANCTPTPVGAGAGGEVTVYREIAWPPARAACFLAASCSE